MLIPRADKLVKITVCCVEPPLGVTLSPAGNLANFCNQATLGQTYGVEDPLQCVLQQPFFVTNSIYHLWESNRRPVCQRLEFHTHTDLHW